MKVYFAADHAGFELKAELMNFVRGELGHDVVDCGNSVPDPNDDYPQFIGQAAAFLSKDSGQGIDSRAVLIGASGQGEAMVANRFANVRAAVFYGQPGGMQVDASGVHLDLLRSTRMHNNANALSLGARFMSKEDAKEALRIWLLTPFSSEERHRRRVQSIEHYPTHD